MSATNLDEGLVATHRDEERFYLSAAHARTLSIQLVHVNVVLGLLLFCAIIGNTASLNLVWTGFFCANAAVFCLLSAGLLAARDMADWRRNKMEIAEQALPPFEAWLIRVANKPWAYTRGTQRPNGGELADGTSTTSRTGPGNLRFITLSSFALLIAYLCWNATGEVSSTGTASLLFGSIGLAYAFWLLIMERRFAQTDKAEWPEAHDLSRLLRLAAAVLALSSFSLFLSARGDIWPARIIPFVSVLIGLVGIEFVIRLIGSMFQPQSSSRGPIFSAKSIILELISWPPRPLFKVQSGLHDKFGIDLQQIWALSFVRKTAPIVFLLTLLSGWLLTGVRELPISGRGIYERFGKAEGVLNPGLHIGLPWPFGRIVPVENGAVHELATSFNTNSEDEALPDAEASAPDSANRLWDSSHISEKSQIIAGSSDDAASFQLVNMDVRFFYRIGLSDRAALNAAYQVADISTLIESTANRVLVHDFAARTLSDVLGEQRTVLADEISAAIQRELDSLNSGVEILAVVVEAIHPPAGTSNAYHGVQAAQIGAQALVSRERGNAAVSINDAQRTASLERDSATAAAQEMVQASQVAKLQFDAEKSAYHEAGQAFLTEEYLSRLKTGLAQSKSLIIDHRIATGGTTTLDLRSMTTPIDPSSDSEETKP